MDLLLPLLAVALMAGRKKKEKQESGDEFETITPPNIEKPKAGQANLKIDKVRKLLNRVDFTFTDGQLSQEFKHKWKGGEKTSGIVGKWKVEAMTTIEPDPKKPGKFIEGPVMVIAKEAGKDPRFVKRVLVNEGKVIDIK